MVGVRLVGVGRVFGRDQSGSGRGPWSGVGSRGRVGISRGRVGSGNEALAHLPVAVAFRLDHEKSPADPHEENRPGIMSTGEVKFRAPSRAIW